VYFYIIVGLVALIKSFLKAEKELCTKDDLDVDSIPVIVTEVEDKEEEVVCHDEDLGTYTKLVIRRYYKWSYYLNNEFHWYKESLNISNNGFMKIDRTTLEPVLSGIETQYVNLYHAGVFRKKGKELLKVLLVFTLVSTLLFGFVISFAAAVLSCLWIYVFYNIFIEWHCHKLITNKVYKSRVTAKVIDVKKIATKDCSIPWLPVLTVQYNYFGKKYTTEIYGSDLLLEADLCVNPHRPQEFITFDDSLTIESKLGTVIVKTLVLLFIAAVIILPYCFIVSESLGYNYTGKSINELTTTVIMSVIAIISLLVLKLKVVQSKKESTNEVKCNKLEKVVYIINLFLCSCTVLTVLDLILNLVLK